MRAGLDGSSGPCNGEGLNGNAFDGAYQQFNAGNCINNVIESTFNGDGGCHGGRHGTCLYMDSVRYGNNPWIRIDMGSTQRVTGVEIYNANDDSLAPFALRNHAIIITDTDTWKPLELANVERTRCNFDCTISECGVEGCHGTGRYVFIVLPGSGYSLDSVNGRQIKLREVYVIGSTSTSGWQIAWDFDAKAFHPNTPNNPACKHINAMRLWRKESLPPTTLAAAAAAATATAATAATATTAATDTSDTGSGSGSGDE